MSSGPLNLNNPDILDDLEALVSGMSDDDKAQLENLIAPELSKVWRPNPGPQTMAYESEADMMLYGGAAGGGKTDLVIGLAATKHQSSAIFRRESVELDGIVDRSRDILSDIGQYNGQDSVWRLDGKTIRFGGMKDIKDWKKFAGRARDLMAFDEAGEFAVDQVHSISAWLRSVDKDQHCRLVLASNPPRGGEGEWMIEWFAPWLDPLFPNPAEPGELRWAYMDSSSGQPETVWCDGPDPVMVGEELTYPKSRTFIPAFVDDNPYYKGDNKYRGTLQSLPEPLRSQLLYGDFLAGREDDDYQIIPTEWIEKAQERWAEKPKGYIMLSLGVDVAQGGKDKTSLAPLYAPAWFGEPIVKPGVDTKDGASVAALVVQNMRNAAIIGIDMTGGWGGAAKEHLEGQKVACIGLNSSTVTGAHSHDSKIPFYNLRAELWWRFREALAPNSGEFVALPPNKRLKAQLTTPRWKLRSGKILVEEKEDIKKRVGSSPDEADSVLMSWHLRDRGLALRRQSEQGAVESAAEESPFADL